MVFILNILIAGAIVSSMFFQGRYKVILAEKEGYLLELSRYVVLNPVRAGMVTNIDQWP